MTDQSVRLTNLPDSGSPERVAYDLYYYMRSMITVKQPPKLSEVAKQHLELYAECRKAAYGRPIETSNLT